MKQHVQIARVRGVAIFIHWSAGLLVVALVPGGLQWPALSAAIGVSYFVLLFVHELGHAVAAQVTRCPAYWIEICAIHGATGHSPPRSEKDAIAIAWGGVLAQCALAAPAWAWHHWGQGLDLPLQITLAILGPLNLAMAVFNLIPAPGFDGATAWRVLRRKRKWRPPETALRGGQRRD